MERNFSVEELKRELLRLCYIDDVEITFRDDEDERNYRIMKVVIHAKMDNFTIEARFHHKLFEKIHIIYQLYLKEYVQWRLIKQICDHEIQYLERRLKEAKILSED